MRIGGILALEQIVQDAPSQVATDAARVLNHFLRDQAPRATPLSWGAARDDRRAIPEVSSDSDTDTAAQLPDEPAADVQAALTALTRAESRTHVDPREILDFRGLHLAGTHLTQADLTGANLKGATLTGANLSGANLTRTILKGATLVDADLSGANLTDANLKRATLTNVNLQEAILTGSDLAGANFSGARMQRAKFTRAYLVWSDLTHTNLKKADLTRADLAGANFANANLSEADLTRANLTHPYRAGGTNFTCTNLEDATLSRAYLYGADLRTVKGLTLGQVRTALTNDLTLLPPNLRAGSSTASPDVV
ncbi:pentapeptide repeat-containing protein [Streptomyces sp. URMC 127]|uniref:pentapeptide repeat-containing protein n=1 Tax=Streptomyces sp. URMC 127 TaxID=3423402 RepID=UPI003F1C812D